jgi:Replication factor-A protein 1, N-terminal domain.
MPQLTAGICAYLQNTPQVDHWQDHFNPPHTVQILSINKVRVITTTNPSVDRYRITISDGVDSTPALLAGPLNYLVLENKIGKHTVATLEQLTCTYVRGKR